MRYARKFDENGLPEHVKRSFSWYFRQLCANETGVMREADIRPVAPDALKTCAGIAQYQERGRQALARGRQADKKSPPVKPPSRRKVWQPSSTPAARRAGPRE